MLGFELGNVADKVGRTKGASKYFALVDLFDEVTALGSVDFKLIDDEIKDLDATERETLHQAIKDKFDIVDDKLENAIEEAIAILSEQVKLVERSIKLVKDYKAESPAA